MIGVLEISLVQVGLESILRPRSDSNRTARLHLKRNNRGYYTYRVCTWKDNARDFQYSILHELYHGILWGPLKLNTCG